MKECEFCKKSFSTMSNLRLHKKSAKYCLKLQNKVVSEYSCCSCDKKFSVISSLNRHQRICKGNTLVSNLTKENDIILHKYNELKIKVADYNKIIEENISMKDKIDELQNAIIQLAASAISNDKSEIKKLIDKYVKKRERKQYPEQNVIYVLTTPSLKKDRRYILGKATNLTNRLSTYNKSDEHEVIYYQSCGTKEDMNMVEPMVFKKLEDHREQANRERFILPENKDIDFFKEKIKECINFFSK